MTGAGEESRAEEEGARRRILIVEDDADSRTVYRLILEHGGYEVVEARTGVEGLERARTDRPDLILMDISIPGVDGWEATRILKLDETTRPIPVIILTAHVLAADRERAEEVGCDGYLAKPVPPSQVLQEVTLRLFPAVGAHPAEHRLHWAP